MEKNCGFDVRPLAMEKQWKNRGTMMKKWSKTMEKKTRQKLVRSWHHLSSIYSVSRILPLPLLLLRTHLRTPLVFVPPFSGMLEYVGM